MFQFHRKRDKTPPTKIKKTRIELPPGGGIGATLLIVRRGTKFPPNAAEIISKAHTSCDVDNPAYEIHAWPQTASLRPDDKCFCGANERDPKDAEIARLREALERNAGESGLCSGD